MIPNELLKELDELESRLERLRIKYEQYFSGVEKMLPFVQRKDVDRRFYELHKEYIRNTGLRFRFQSMSQRFTSLQTHWGRVIRQIEEGTYKRDVAKARRLAAALEAERRAADEPQEISADMLEEVEDPADSQTQSLKARPAPIVSLRPPSVLAREELPLFPDEGDSAPEPVTRAPASAAPPRESTGFFGASQRPSPVLPPPVAPPQRPTPAASMAPVALADPAMQRLFERYLEARRQTGESTSVHFESVARQVRDSLPRLAEKYKGSDVSLDVTIKDGKAVLRPVVSRRKP